MLRVITNRLIAMVLTMWAVSFVAFAIIQLPPGDYLTTYIATLSANGDRVDPATIEALRQQYGFGEPYIVQYWKWISGIMTRGDFGQSFEWKAPVTQLIWGRLGNSILLEGLAVIVMWLVALPSASMRRCANIRWAITWPPSADSLDWRSPTSSSR